jgi:hypothetical protein
MQFLPRLGRGEAPCNGGFGRIAGVFVGSDLTPQRGLVWDAAIQTLPTLNAQLDFRHIQPTAVLGGVMELQLFQPAAGLYQYKGLVQRGRL